MGLVAMAAWFAATGGFWAFADRAATAKHISDNAIGAALAIGNTVGLLGSVAAAWQKDRWGRAGPIVAATVGLDDVAEVLAGHRPPDWGGAPKIHVDPRC